MGKLKDQLAGIAALIAAIVAIGGGFVKYGEIVTKLDPGTYDEVIHFMNKSNGSGNYDEKINVLVK